MTLSVAGVARPVKEKVKPSDTGHFIGGIISAVGSTASGLLSKGGGANLGEYSSTLNKLAQQYITPFANDPGFWDLNLGGLANTSMIYGLGNAPTINAANMQQLQQMLNTALPGYGQMVGQMQTNTQSMLQGILPTDVEQAMQRAGAAATLTGTGIGAGGPGFFSTVGARTARQAGLTSLDLQEKGFTQGTNLMQLARNYLMPQPVDPTKLLPLSDLIHGTEYTKNAIYTSNYNAYAAEAAAAAARVGAPPPNAAAGIAGGIGALNTFLSQNPSGQKGGQTGYGMLGQLFGGGGGGGGGGDGGLIDLSSLSAGTSFGY